MQYNVVVQDPKSGNLVTLVTGPSLDYLPDKFRRIALKQVTKPKNLLSKLEYYIINSIGESEGMMLWVEAEGHKDPILMVQLNNRNVLYLYDIKGRLISKDRIE